MHNKIFKIETKDNWQKAQLNGVYKGSQLDVKDGFIHLSTIAQAQQTLNLYFQNIENLIIAQIKTDGIGEKLKWEKSRNGELFPHIYGDLEMEFVENTFNIKYQDGKPFLPDELLV